MPNDYYIQHFTNAILSNIGEQYHSAEDPQGWVLGEVIVHYLGDYYLNDATVQPEELYGLPIIIDHKDKQRIELVE